MLLKGEKCRFGFPVVNSTCSARDFGFMLHCIQCKAGCQHTLAMQCTMQERCMLPAGLMPDASTGHIGPVCAFKPHATPIITKYSMRCSGWTMPWVTTRGYKYLSSLMRLSKEPESGPDGCQTDLMCTLATPWSPAMWQMPACPHSGDWWTKLRTVVKQQEQELWGLCPSRCGCAEPLAAHSCCHVASSTAQHHHTHTSVIESPSADQEVHVCLAVVPPA